LRRGHRVNIVASEVDRSICADPGVALYPIDVSAIPTQLLRDAVFDRRAQRVVRKLRASSDIVHVNGAVVSAASDVNSAHFVHGSNARFHSGPWGLLKSPYQLYQFAYTLLNISMERRSFRRSKAVVAVSQTVAADLIALGVDREKLFVIYNGIDLDEFSPGQEDRCKLGLPIAVPLGIFVGDIKGSRKNLDTVLRTMVVNPDVHLAVLASYERTAARQLAAELGIAERVHFLGQRNDVAAIMRAADMLIFPSRYEPFGMVILEALASGLPVIASRAAGASEIFEPGCGIIIEDPDSITELSQAIRRLVDDPALRERMGRQGRIVAEKYSWTRMAQQYVRRYSALVFGPDDAASPNAVPAYPVAPIELIAP
jgi:glycosyltransferase involved in cell wall biosynthesis